MSSNNRFYSKLDLRRNFKDQTYQRGYQYYQQGRVLTAEIFENTEHSDRLRIYGEVEGSGTNEYQVTADIQLPSPRNRSSKCQLEGDCTCPVSFDCKHVVAILFHMLDQGDNKTTPYELLRSKASNAMPIATTAEQFSLWSDKLIRAQEYKKPASTELIVYIMKTQQYRSGHILSIKPMLTRILKKGGYGVTKRYSGTGTVAERATTDEDRRLLALLGSMTVSSVHFDYEFDLCFQQANELFTELLQTQRLFWNNISNTPLALGSTNTLELAWRIEENGCQKLEYSVEGISDKQDLTLLPFASPWYYNKSNNTCGQIQNDIASKLLFPMLDLPALEPTAVETAQQQLKKLQPNKNAFPLPATLKKGLAPKAMLQKVIVRLLGAKVAEKSHYYSFSHEEDVLLPFAELAFYYNDQLTTLAEHKTIITQYKNNKIIELKRDLTWEQSCVDKLIALDITPMLLNKDYILNDAVEFSFLFESQEDDEELLLTKVNELKQLANENGWQVNIDESFPMQIVDEIDEWYSDIEEGARGIDWFSLTLGVIVKGEKVNLLPLLVDLIKNRFHNLDTNAIAALPDDTDCTLKLQNGHFITVPFARIRNILLVLCELFDSKALDENGALELSHLQAGLLLEIKKAMSATQMRWFGGERLLAFAEKLTHFKGIKTVNPAKTLKATLRPYQQEGLNWLQFLREHDIGGILADDMGLGKTVQTLAHFGVEKAARRLKCPSLLIAPTSLVHNWSSEAKRFCPNLSILVLHGANRKEQYSNIKKADIVITTYPLVMRDKAILLTHDFYYIVLDEAQAIKNAKAKSTQVILQLSAKHRICLTGTPMENHLGELWSLYNFVLPGLLGSSKQFKTLFRTPIERHGDALRYEQLANRIKPFLLRRRKDDVLKELPPKTEIIRHIEIEGAQRDLYETIRLSMEKKVRDAIHAKGMARSQIMILDALLKLRQICCAPSLLKLKTIQQAIASAKLDDLMNFLPSLIEEGRQVLLFSSFTSMLALIEAQLNERSIGYVKLTGQTRDRQTPIERFQNAEVPLFLISLKAGGVGLNLTAADTVIHYDPWWNPAAEQQATDRAHRIGQTKPVFVYKLITKGTVEEKILQMQNKKKALISGVIEQKHVEKVQLTPDDLNFLFQPLS